MDSWLVLGCGSVGHVVLDALRERPGRVAVAAGDDRRVEALRNEGVPAQLVDVSDPAAVADAFDVESVDYAAVLGDDPATNRAAVRTAREVVPDAYLFAYAGREATAADREALAEGADHVFAPGEALAEHVGDRVGEAGDRLRRLRRVLRDVDGRLAIVTHDNPDPDAIASALALQRVARAVGREADVCYYGDISHQENRALVNLLEYDLRNLEPDADLSEYAGFALVDHSRPGVNDGLPPETEVDIVVDHHPPRGPVDARFLDLRTDAGATSTLLVDYLGQLDREIDDDIATGLLFGIRVDTRDFTREVSVTDFEAAATLLPNADLELLDRIESPSVSVETFDLLATAIKNSDVRDGVLTSYVGRIGDRDALAQAADQLLDREDVTATLVFGVMDGTVYASARARGAPFDLGEVLRDAYGQIGSAGGHADMAGAQIGVGMLADPEADPGADGETADPDATLDSVGEVMRGRFHEAVDAVYGYPSPPTYAQALDVDGDRSW